jgi:hypothetical protein
MPNHPYHQGDFELSGPPEIIWTELGGHLHLAQVFPICDPIRSDARDIPL